jgi:PAS domain S-box-containing protein
MHILPTEDRFVVFPSYESGNYAFMFDDEGWIISHPKFCDIRSLKPDGTPFDPADPSYNRENLLACKVPFHLDSAGVINPNYPLIAAEVRKGRSGVTTTFNVGGIPRVMAYAPILYHQKPYDRYGIFGGITIGVETRTFGEPVVNTKRAIAEALERTKIEGLVVLGFTIVGSILLSIYLARNITSPILHLARKAREIADRRIPQDIELHTGDEIATLSVSLASMAQEVHQYRTRLEQSLRELSASKKSLEQYSYELEKQIWIIKNIHYLSQLLSTVYERERVLEEVLKTAVEGLGYDRSILYLFDSSSRRLVCHRTFRFSPEHEERARAASFHVDRQDCSLIRAFRLGKTIFMENLWSSEEATELDRRIAEEGNSESVVWTPVKTKERVIGVIGADRMKGNPPVGKTEVEALEILANDAARAIERSELYWRLVEEKNFISSILIHIPTGIIALDEDGKIRWFNRYAEEFFGIKDVTGRCFRDVFADFPSWNNIVEELRISTCSPSSVTEQEITFPDGKVRVVEYSCSTIRETGRNTMHLLFFRDVTKRKEMEEHVRRTDRLASLGVLAAGIAHEMRNPLTGISLMLDDLHDRLHERPEDRELIRQALREIERLENLVSGLLDFANPSRALRLETVSMSSVIADTLFLIRKLAKNYRIHISTDVEENAPPLKIDREKMKQVLLNLCLNAIQAMPEGGNLSIKVNEVSTENSLISRRAIRIVVTDTGKGIAAEDLPYIFDPFFSRNPSGSGLGLAIVHSIVIDHGGKIFVSSSVGKGTTFTIELPLEETDHNLEDHTP